MIALMMNVHTNYCIFLSEYIFNDDYNIFTNLMPHWYSLIIKTLIGIQFVQLSNLIAEFILIIPDLLIFLKFKKQVLENFSAAFDKVVHLIS
jgi:hypothetical protein